MVLAAGSTGLPSRPGLPAAAVPAPPPSLWLFPRPTLSSGLRVLGLVVTGNSGLSVIERAVLAQAAAPGAHAHPLLALPPCIPAHYCALRMTARGVQARRFTAVDGVRLFTPPARGAIYPRASRHFCPAPMSC